MDEDTTIFVSEAIEHGLSLPLSQAARFFRGFVLCAEGRISPVDEDRLRAAVMRLVESEGQLRLLSGKSN